MNSNITKILLAFVAILWAALAGLMAVWGSDIYSKVNDSYFVRTERYISDKHDLCQRIDRLENNIHNDFNRITDLLEKIRSEQKKP